MLGAKRGIPALPEAPACALRPGVIYDPHFHLVLRAAAGHAREEETDSKPMGWEGPHGQDSLFSP